MTDKRSHRNVYYDKVLKQTHATEKTKLHELLCLRPMPVQKLQQHCSTCILPDQYRVFVWKLMLGIVPRYAAACEFVRRQRELMFWDAWHALVALRLRKVQWQAFDADDNHTELLTSKTVCIRRSPQLGYHVEGFLDIGLRSSLPALSALSNSDEIHQSDDLKLRQTLSEKIFGCFIFKNHYIGFKPSGQSETVELDFKSVEEETSETVPSLLNMLQMWLLSRGTLCASSHESQLLTDTKLSAFLSLGDRIALESDEDMFSFLSFLWDFVSANKDKIVTVVVQRTPEVMKSRSAVAASLCQSLDSRDFFRSPFLQSLALSLFTPALSRSATERVLDKVLAKCFDFLSFLLVELLLQIRKSLSETESVEESLLLLVNMKPVDSEAAVKAALETWHKLNSLSFPSE